MRPERPPPRKTAASSELGGRKVSPLEEQQIKRTSVRARAQALPWVVVAGNREFGRYITRAGALAVVRRLHAKGMVARIEGGTT